LCNKAFSQYNSHIAYQHINSVEHLCYCDVCNNTFAVKCHMVRHQRLHSVECTVPLQCAVQHSVKRGTY
jgi:hypothetical protein